jgi:hypothetical protein
MKSYTELRDGLAQRSGRFWKPTCPSPSHSPRWPRGTTRKATRKMATGAKAKLRKPSRRSVISSQQPTCILVSSGRRLPGVRLKKKSYQLEDRVMEGYAMLNEEREAAEKAIKAARRAELKTIPFDISSSRAMQQLDSGSRLLYMGRSSKMRTQRHAHLRSTAPSACMRESLMLCGMARRFTIELFGGASLVAQQLRLR